MGKLDRGNLLATIKKLKKMPRPKVVISNPAVQAICGGSPIKPNKTADLKVVVERRRTMLDCGHSKQVAEKLVEFNKEFDAFMVAYNKSKE